MGFIMGIVGLIIISIPAIFRLIRAYKKYPVKTYKTGFSKNDAVQQAQKVLCAANNFSFYIRKESGKDNKLVYYEEVFFFYFLNDVSLTLKNIPVEVTTKIFPAILNILSKTTCLDFERVKDYIEVVNSYRFKNYSNLLLKYNEKFTKDFFQASILYQSELISTIFGYDKLLDIKTKPSSISEWIQKAAENNYMINIKRILLNHYGEILNFIYN